MEFVAKFRADRRNLVGLSNPRRQRFEGLEQDVKLAEADSAPWCGIQILDLETKTCVEWFRIDGTVAELHNPERLPGDLCPTAIAPGTPKATSLITLP